MPTKQDDWEKWFQGVWEQREEHIYRELFGDLGDRIHTIPEALFQRFHDGPVDARWTTHGVFACPPSGKRLGWVYVTSGLSNPWGTDPATINRDEYSGLGFEFLLMTAEESPWAIGVLQWVMAVQILVASGLAGGELLECNDRVPLGVSIDPEKQSLLRNLLVTEPETFPRQFELDSGKVDLLLCVGITDREMEFAEAQGGPGLVTLLKHREIFPLTDATRGSAL